jgi:hypothetical protein
MTDATIPAIEFESLTKVFGGGASPRGLGAERGDWNSHGNDAEELSDAG